MFEEILVVLLALVCYAIGSGYTENHLITFYPEVGQDAITDEELVRLEEEHLRSVLSEEEMKKAA